MHTYSSEQHSLMASRNFRGIQISYLLTDLILMGIAFFLPYVVRFRWIDQTELPNLRLYLSVYGIWTIFIVTAFQNAQLYSTDRGLTIPRELAKVAYAVCYTSVLLAAVIFFAKYKLLSRQVFASNVVLLCVLLGGFRTVKRLILRRLIRKGFYNLNVLIIGAGRIARLAAAEIRKNRSWGLRPTGFLDDTAAEKQVAGIPVLGTFADFAKVAKSHFIDEVLITVPADTPQIVHLRRLAKGLRLGIKVIPTDFEESLPLPQITYLGPIPLISYKQRVYHPAEFATKRVFDFCVALIALICLSPLLLLIALMIRFDSPGPILYRQKRVGFKGKIFTCYKFRSMIVNADALKKDLLAQNEVPDGVIFKMKNDPRVTRQGRLLRRYSLDELPQIVNVLKGDMSLVGPRPPVPTEVKEYSHNHMERLSIRPGLTGLSQVRGRSTLTFRKWVRWDLWYIQNWSFWLDMRILWWTIPAVLRGKDAY